MKGKLYGIGVGPGDPELLTIKAINAIWRCGVIAAPKTGEGEGAALSIVEDHLQGKTLIECRFSMDGDLEKRKAARLAAAGDILRFLEDGQDVGFVTLGDPTTYSTYMYVHEIVVGMGFEAEIIPGVTSFAAAAAALGVALCEGGETLTIIPARHSESIGDLLDNPGNKVIMKSGANLAKVLEELKARGYGDRTKIACRAAMDGQRLYGSIGEFERADGAGGGDGATGAADAGRADGTRNAGYFTLAIVK